MGENGTFEILGDMSEYVTLVQSMELVVNENHAVSVL